MIDAKDLRVFVRIADLRSISAAARALKAPKSSVSRSLSRLERELGAVLVERSTHHLRLTEAGVLFKPHAMRVLDDLEEARNALGGVIGKASGTLRINVPFGFAHMLLAPMLPAFLARYPDIRVLLDIDNRRIDLLAEDVDLVIRLGKLEDSDLIASHLRDIEVWACASPAYLAARGTPAEAPDLARHDLVGRLDRETTWTLTRQGDAIETFTFEPRACVPEPATLKVVIEAGAGIGLVPDFMATGAIAAGTLERIFPDATLGLIPAHALFARHRSASAKVRVFVDALLGLSD